MMDVCYCVKVSWFLIFAIFFTPLEVFGWKSISFKNECFIHCQLPYGSIAGSHPMDFLLLGVFGIFGIVIFYKIQKIKKFDVISLKCSLCGRKTNGLKCPLCEERKID